MNLPNALSAALAVTILTCVSPVWAQSQIGTKLSSRSFTDLQEGILKSPILITPVKKANIKLDSTKIKMKPQGGTGVDGGGGDIKPVEVKILTPETLSNYLKHRSSKALRYIFNAFQGNNDFSHYDSASNQKVVLHLKSVHAKLFGSKNGDTIFSVLDSAALKLQAEPCFDATSGQHKDARAYANENYICLSYERIKSKINPSNLDPYLIPLLIHEYSHLVGSTEDEAEALEEYFTKMEDLTFEGITDKIEKFEDEVSNVHVQFYMIMAALDKLAASGNANQICKKALDLNLAAESFQGARTGIWQISMVPHDKRYLIEALDLRIQNLVLFCEHTGLKSELDEGSEFGGVTWAREYLWKRNEKELSLFTAVSRKADSFDEHYGDDFGTWLGALRNEEKMERVNPNNRRGLQNELTKIRKVLERLNQNTQLFYGFGAEK